MEVRVSKVNKLSSSAEGRLLSGNGAGTSILGNECMDRRRDNPAGTKIYYRKVEELALMRSAAGTLWSSSLAAMKQERLCGVLVLFSKEGKHVDISMNFRSFAFPSYVRLFFVYHIVSIAAFFICCSVVTSEELSRRPNIV